MMGIYSWPVFIVSTVNLFNLFIFLFKVFDALFSDHVNDAVVVGFSDYRLDENGENAEDRFNLLTPVRFSFPVFTFLYGSMVEYRVLHLCKITGNCLIFHWKPRCITLLMQSDGFKNYLFQSQNG